MGGKRRTDLMIWIVARGLFVALEGRWEGTVAVASTRNLFPIPVAEINTNPKPG